MKLDARQGTDNIYLRIQVSSVAPQLKTKKQEQENRQLTKNTPTHRRLSQREADDGNCNITTHKGYVTRTPTTQGPGRSQMATGETRTDLPKGQRNNSQRVRPPRRALPDGQPDTTHKGYATRTEKHKRTTHKEYVPPVDTCPTVNSS